MLNNQSPQLFLPPETSEPNESTTSTGYPEIDGALELIQAQTIANFKRVSGDAQKFRAWMEQIALSVERYSAENNRVVNGQIEFPTPFVTEQTGNIKCSYIPLVIPTAGAGNVRNPFRVPHNYGDGINGQAPRGWFQMAASDGGVGVRVIDQICESLLGGDPLFGFNAPPTATITAATTITAAAGVFTWVNTGILAGDQIKLSTPLASPNATTVAGSTSVQLAGAPAFTPQEGWFFRVTAVLADTSCHRIESFDATTNVLTVSPPYYVAGGPNAAAIYAGDQEWRAINTVTAGPPDVLTLDSPGTEIPVGTAGCEYVIRRPADATYIWVRCGTGSSPFETTLCCF